MLSMYPIGNTIIGHHDKILIFSVRIDPESSFVDVFNINGCEPILRSGENAVVERRSYMF